MDIIKTSFSQRSFTKWLFALIPLFIISLFLSYIHVYERTVKEIPETFQMYQHLWIVGDYYVYLSAINQGQTGSLLFRNPFITTPRPYLPHYITYVFAGFITKPFHIWPPLVYHGLKFFAQALFLLSCYILATHILKKPFYAWLATLIQFLFTPLPLQFYDQKIVKSFPAWWDGAQNIIGRYDQRPHYTLAYAFLMIALILFIHYEKKQKKRYALLSSFSLFFSVINIPYTIFIFPSLIFFLSFSKIYSYIRKKNIRSIILLSFKNFLLLLPSILLIAIFYFLNKADLVWSAFTLWETNYWKQETSFIRHNYTFYVPIIPFLLAALYKTIRDKNKEMMFLFSWFLLPIVLLIINDYLVISKGRLLHLFIYVPAAIIAAYGLIGMMQNRIKYLIFPYLVIIIAFWTIQIPGIVATERMRMENENYSTLYYPPKFYINTIEKIHKTIPSGSTLLAPFPIANLSITMFPTIMYIGEQTVGLNWNIDDRLVSNFYSGFFSPQEANQYLLDKKITYVLDGPEAPYWENSRVLNYPCLTKLWDYYSFSLYKVN